MSCKDKKWNAYDEQQSAYMTALLYLYFLRDCKELKGVIHVQSCGTSSDYGHLTSNNGNDDDFLSSTLQ